MTEDISIESHCCWLIGIGVKEELSTDRIRYKKWDEKGRDKCQNESIDREKYKLREEDFYLDQVRIKHHEKYHETSIFETNLIARRIIC